MITVAFPEGAASILIVLVLSTALLFLFRHFAEDKDFVTTVFLVALLIRLAFGIFVHVYELRDFFGGDALTYDNNGWRLAQYWTGEMPNFDTQLDRASSTKFPGWGMNYLVAAIYLFLGRNIFAAQSFCGVIGAATAPLIYFCSIEFFQNQRVGKIAAVGFAVFPAFVVWSSQLMKDGLIIMLLVLAMTMVLQLQKRLSVPVALVLVLSLFGIISLRFYIFYMVALAVVGAFLVGLSSTAAALTRNAAILVFLGLALTYLGVIRNASFELDRFGTLEAVERSRSDLASAESGYGEDYDVSTAEGALTTIPIGFAYLIFAPFPWEARNLRQAITIPEVLIWWALIPFAIYGLKFTITHRLRRCIPILIFTLMLTLAYSIFQGNVGTAYRQRTQIQVFLFIFIAVGITLVIERNEDKKLVRKARGQALEQRLKGARLG